jgi:gliding motility-associated-like protein
VLGSYSPTLIVRDSYGCRDTIVKTVNVYPVPFGIANADTISLCYGDSIVLEGSVGYATYDWSPGTYLSDSTIAQPTAYAVDTITYILVTTDFTSCQSFDTVTINVLPLPTLSLTPYPDTNICFGDTVQLVAVGDIIYEWEPPVEISDVNIANPIVFPTNSRYYKVTTTDIFGCKTSDSVKVIINRFFPEFEGERSCLGSPADFVSVSAYSDRPITQYAWDFGDGSPVDVQSGRLPVHTFPDSGFYEVTLTVFDIIGCSDSITKTIQVDFPFDAFAGNDTLICLGATAQLYSGEGDSVYWRPTNGMDNPSSFTPNVSPTTNTTYTAYVSNGVCPADTASVRIVVNPLPSVNTLENRMINRGVSIELTTTAGVFDSVYWNTTDTTISCLNCLSPTATPFASTLYVVTAVDNFGCISSDSVFISVNEFCNEDVVFVPTGFTPNGDGANDMLYARMFGAKELILFRVFDRWGKLLFETNNPNIGWDGTNRDNEKLITGVYVYVVEAVCYNGEKLIKKGNITLLK